VLPPQFIPGKKGSLAKRLKQLSPAQLLTLFYAFAIFLGAALLATPLAARGEPVAFIDALFTALLSMPSSPRLRPNALPA